MGANGRTPRFQAFWLPKRGSTSAEYEDAFAANVALGRFAIADGASESSFAASWAQLLVQGFAQAAASPLGEWEAWLPSLQEGWSAEAGGRPLPWYAEVKREQGAFATFLGLQVEPASRRHRYAWCAVAVGDSCLFQIRRGRLLRAFPITRSDAFDNSPWLVGSRNCSAGVLAKKEVRAAGRGRPLDQLWLMTDALAQWFLRQQEGDRMPADTLAGILAHGEPSQGFAACIEVLRDRGELRNDDVTWMAIQL